MIWCIWGKDDALIGCNVVTTNDTLDVHLSLFRGPNVIIWNCKEPSNGLTVYSQENQVYTLSIFRERSNNFDQEQKRIGLKKLLLKNRPNAVYNIPMHIQALNWNNEYRKSKQALEVRFIPALLNVIKYNYIHCALHNLDNKKYYGTSGIVKHLLRDAGQIKIEIDKVINKSYKNYFHSGTIEEGIWDLCYMNNFEYMCTGDKLIIANRIGTPSKLKYLYQGEIVHTVFKHKKGGINYVSGAIKDVLPLPGYEVSILTHYGRIIYNHLSFSKNNGFVQNFIMSDNKILEWQLIDILPTYAKNLIGSDVFPVQTNAVGKILKDVDHEGEYTAKKKVGVHVKRPDRWDLQNTLLVERFKDNDIPTLYDTVPYAAGQYGILFPSHTGTAIVSYPWKQKDQGAIVGEIYQNGIFPPRNNVQDFVLNVPGPMTLYSSSVNKYWTMTAPTGIFLGVGEYELDGIWNSVGGDSFIDMDYDSIEMKVKDISINMDYDSIGMKVKDVSIKMDQPNNTDFCILIDNSGTSIDMVKSSAVDYIEIITGDQSMKLDKHNKKIIIKESTGSTPVTMTFAGGVVDIT